MDKYQETFNTWDKVADQYEDKFMDLDLYNDTYDRFCDLLKQKKSKVLEIGCGPGNITKYLLRKRPDLEILGIDIAPQMIKLARINNPSATFEVMDSRNIDSIKDVFDGIMIGFCLPYLSNSDVRKLLIDCQNLLTKDGVLYISFVKGDYLDSGFIKGKSDDRMYFYYHDLKGMIDNLEQSNFEILDSIKKSYHDQQIHDILIAQYTS